MRAADADPGPRQMTNPDRNRLHEGRIKHRHRRPPGYYVCRRFIGGEQVICLVSGPASRPVEALNFDDLDGNLGDTFERWRAEERRAAPALSWQGWRDQCDHH